MFVLTYIYFVNLFSLFCFCFYTSYLILPCKKFGSPYLGKASTAAARAALPIHTSVCVYFRQCVQTMLYGCQCLGFLTCAQMLMREIAHGGCTDTMKGCALKVNPWRKIACCTGKPFFFFFFTTVACCTGKPFFFFLQLSLVVLGNRFFYNCRLLYRETVFFTTAPIGRLWFI